MINKKIRPPCVRALKWIGNGNIRPSILVDVGLQQDSYHFRSTSYRPPNLKPCRRIVISFPVRHLTHNPAYYCYFFKNTGTFDLHNIWLSGSQLHHNSCIRWRCKNESLSIVDSDRERLSLCLAVVVPCCRCALLSLCLPWLLLVSDFEFVKKKGGMFLIVHFWRGHAAKHAFYHGSWQF